MVDLGRISSRRWAISLLVILCIFAVLFIAPWILSVFYESDSYENWNEEILFKSREKGNITLLCASSGPCLACTSIEKADASSKCSPTGYHQPQKCIEDTSALTKDPKALQTTEETTEDPIQGKGQQGSRREGASEQNFDGDGDNERRSLIAEDTAQATVIYKTCVPPEVREKFSVFGFEGIVLVCLLLGAPAVHYRKKRGSSVPGMERIPSSARF